MAGAIYSTVDSAPDIAPADVRNALGRLATSTNKVETKMADTSEMSAAVKKNIFSERLICKQISMQSSRIIYWKQSKWKRIKSNVTV